MSDGDDGVLVELSSEEVAQAAQLLALDGGGGGGDKEGALADALRSKSDAVDRELDAAVHDVLQERLLPPQRCPTWHESTHNAHTHASTKQSASTWDSAQACTLC